MNPEAYAKNNKPESGNQPGTYKHPKSNETLEVTDFAQADALVRQEWVFVAPLRPAQERAEEAAERQAAADKETGVPGTAQAVGQNQFSNDKKGK